jgi:hypothetical protein
VANTLGVPFVTENPSLSTMMFVENKEPVIFRQSVQWQRPYAISKYLRREEKVRTLSRISPVDLMRIAPQKQPPSNIVDDYSPGLGLS